VSVNLRDIVYRARDLLGEQTPNFWKNDIVINLANEALQDMCSDAQNLETLIQFPWPFRPKSTLLAEEAALPVSVDQVIWCGYYSGQFFQLQPMEQSAVLVTNRVSGIPVGFYIRTDTRDILTQGGLATNTGDMTIDHKNPNPSIGQDYFTALGFWPIPQQQLNTTIACTRFHKRVENPLDRCAIPRRFILGPIHYILWQSKLKQENMDVAATHQQIYEKVKMEMNHYYTFNKQLTGFPDWGASMWPTLTRGSSSVIFVDQNPGLR
jgi:hypothetical protein